MLRACARNACPAGRRRTPRGVRSKSGAPTRPRGSDLAAERRLRDVEPLRGAADVALLGDGDEIADLGEAHRDTVSRPALPAAEAIPKRYWTPAPAAAHVAAWVSCLFGPQERAALRRAGLAAAETLAFIGEKLASALHAARARAPPTSIAGCARTPSAAAGDRASSATTASPPPCARAGTTWSATGSRGRACVSRWVTSSTSTSRRARWLPW